MFRKRRVVKLRILEDLLANHSQIHQRQRDEDHLDIEVYVGQLRGCVLHDEDGSRHCIHPETKPEDREVFFEWSESQTRGKSEDPHVNAGTHADTKSHADGMDCLLYTSP